MVDVFSYLKILLSKYYNIEIMKFLSKSYQIYTYEINIGFSSSRRTSWFPYLLRYINITFWWQLTHWSVFCFNIIFILNIIYIKTIVMKCLPSASVSATVVKRFVRLLICLGVWLRGWLSVAADGENKMVWSRSFDDWKINELIRLKFNHNTIRLERENVSLNRQNSQQIQFIQLNLLWN